MKGFHSDAFWFHKESFSDQFSKEPYFLSVKNILII